MNKIIVAPFSLKTVLLYEKLRKVLKTPLFFFDNNIRLEKKKYKDTYIVRPFYIFGAKIIISSEYYGEEIRKMYIDIGYNEEDFISEEQFELCNDIVAAHYVDENNFNEIYLGVQGIKKNELRKLRRLYDISAIEYMNMKDVFGNDEYGHGRREVVVDSIGKRHIFLKRLELDITSKCSLKCKKCSNMMQYYENPCDIEKDIILRDYERMLDLVEWIDELLIIGGEPFVYKDLAQLINDIGKNINTSKKIGMMLIVTNGTIVPHNSVLEAIKKNNVFVLISNYGKMSRNIESLINKLCEYNIDYEVMNIGYWANVEQYVDAKEIMSENIRLFWRNNMCSTLHRVVDNGRFYLCCHLKSLDQLRAISSEAKKCYVDIYDKNADKALEEYLCVENPLPKACSWCNGNSLQQWESDRINAAEQTKQVLKYTKY